MKRLVLMIFTAAALVMGIQSVSLASDWDKAGKVLAATEILRVITGGRADVVGTVTGVNKPRHPEPSRVQPWDHGRNNRRGHERTVFVYNYPPQPDRCEQIWVPHYVWQEKYVPEHYERRGGREIFVGSHYERFQVEQGGHWESECR